MIYNDDRDYKVKFYIKTSGKVPVKEYIDGLSDKERAKVLKYIEFLRERDGVLDEPYAKHIRGKIRELRVDFGKNKHRIFYFTFINKNIILLHAFLKKTPKTPVREIKKVEEYLEHVINNEKIYG